jgi:predicted SAM-dependent methyltransferase
MVDQRFKDIYINLLSIPNKINFWRYKFLSVPLYYRKSPIRLHLGCGQKYHEGFINIDINIFRKKEIWLDIRKGLPFREDSVDSIYSHSVFEHLYPKELLYLLKECYRVLRPGCGMRVAVPNLEAAINGYAIGDLSWISDFPRRFASLCGKFYNFIFCDGQHKMCFDFSLLEEILAQAGFRDIVKMEAQKSRIYVNGQIKEKAPDYAHLYVECFKR